MKRFVLTSSLLLVGWGHALTLSGNVSGGLPGKARVGAWLVDAAGRPLSEVASTPANGGTFSLTIPDLTPSGRAVWTLTADNISWPGVTGEVSLPGGVQGGEVRLFVYGDTNGNNRRDDGEELFEASPRLGKASVAIVYASRGANVTAGRGFSVSLGSGWNVVTIELSKALKATAQSGASGLQLSIAR